MADEEDENAPKFKKDKEKDLGPELAPGDVVNLTEYNMFDKVNMQKTLSIPQKQIYSFQKELAGTLKRRLEAIRVKCGTDDAQPVADKKEPMELTAGLQAWEEVDPVSGQLLEIRDGLASAKEDTEGQTLAALAALHITPSVITTMRASLPIPKQQNRNAMPLANRRAPATPTIFEGAAKADGHAEFGDYYEVMEKLDKQWRSGIGRRQSELNAEKLKHDAAKSPKDKRKMGAGSSIAIKATHSNLGTTSKDALALKLVPTYLRFAHRFTPGGGGEPIRVKKGRKQAGIPAFLDGVINYFNENVSPDCNLESWLAPVSLTPVFKIRDIPPDVENTILTIAKVTHSKFIDDQGIALQIRSALDKYHGYACKWHVIVGRRFGMQANADRGNFLFMYIGHLAYVVFRTFG